MWGTADPVAAGLIASLARPGGNVTGIALLAPEQRVKRLSLLRELLPGLWRVGELDASTNPGLRAERRKLEEAYRSLGMEPIFVDIDRVTRFDDMLAEMVKRRAQALNLINDTLYQSWIPQIFEAAIAVSLPTIVNDYGLVEAGALLSYEEDEKEVLRKGAVLVDKLLRGAKPADLPVEQPTKFILGINLKTAKALGITIPQSLLQRADKVVQ
jgi:putative ABC transport system substrate-binding protein